MKNILIVNQSGGYMLADIANAFAKSMKYDSVVIATGSDLSSFVLEDSIVISKLKRYNTQGTISRFFSWTIAWIQLYFRIKFHYKEYELFFVSNPPIDSFLHYFCKNEYSTLIYDVYPDGLGEFASKKSPIYRLWTKNNISFYQKAKYVFTLTESMKKTLTQYCPAEKIEVVPVWADNIEELTDEEKNNNLFVTQHPELRDKFIVLYSGNIGLDHDLTCLLNVMKKLENTNVVLCIIGGGYNKKPLQEKAQIMKLTNCFFYPFQPKEMTKYSLGCADIGIVATKPNGRSSSIPSKAFNLMKLGKPLLCIAHPESEISLLVNRHDVGKSFMTDQDADIFEYIQDIYSNKELAEQYRVNNLKASLLYTKDLANRFIKE